MSGPITAIMVVDPLSVVLAATAINAAEAIRDGYAQANALNVQHTRSRAAKDEIQTQANQHGHAELHDKVRDAEEAFAQLTGVAESLGVAEQVVAIRPNAPSNDDFSAWATYLETLYWVHAELRRILHNEADRQAANISVSEKTGEIKFDDQSLPISATQRLLARVKELGPLPEKMQRLVEALSTTLPGDRADLLTMELRAQIQAHTASVQQRQVQEATATVVEQSLKDLGYQVEPITDTLFVDGGVLHFRRADWGNYMLRMRIDAQTQTANFNVIRAVTADNNERSILDHLAEDRWCAEFPTLLKTLAARGVHLNVTRRLQAGELPVQMVDADRLPQFKNDEQLSPDLKSQVLQRKLS